MGDCLASGSGLYRGGYAAGSRCTGDYGSDVSECVSKYLYGTVSGGIHLHYKGNQFLSNHADWFWHVSYEAFQEMMLIKCFLGMGWA